MGKYIDAEKLIAEIKGIIAAVKVKKHPNELGSIEQCLAAAEIEALNLALDCIKELQQEQPEVDLNKEIEMYISSSGLADYAFLVPSIARHFYERGMLNAIKQLNTKPEVECTPEENKLIEKI